MSAAKPLTIKELDSLLSGLGPFEARPRIAVAVSGGGDSLALCLLAHRWASRRKGKVFALTVDHGLRAGSGAEARQVGDWLAEWDIVHHVLRWRGAKPKSNIQAAARDARYELLGNWCRRQGVLHLLLGHHMEDQADTLILRLGRGSGLDGLAAMAEIGETPRLRLLRPLLSVPRARLAATLRRLGQNWIEDPSNRDTHHARVRVRQSMPALESEGVSAARLAAATRHLGRARAALDEATAHFLARAAELHPAGFCRLDLGMLADAPAEISLRALARTLVTVSGGTYPPRFEHLERLHRVLVEAGAAPDSGKAAIGGRTLAGCQVVPSGGRALICREPAAADEVLRPAPGTEVRWDNRFSVTFSKGRRAPAKGLTLARLGRDGWAEIAGHQPDPRKCPIPGPARAALPAFRDARGILAVPHLQYGRQGSEPASLGIRDLRFEPPMPLAGASFSVVSGAL